MSEKSVIDAVSVDNIRKHVEHIVTNIPSRLAGSENARRMAEYSAETLRQAGVESQVYPIPAIVSFPGPAEMRVEAPTAIAIQANTLGHSLATLDDGIAAELVLSRPRLVQGLREQKRCRPDHIIGTFLFARAPREAAYRNGEGGDRRRHDELGAR